MTSTVACLGLPVPVVLTSIPHTRASITCLFAVPSWLRDTAVMPREILQPRNDFEEHLRETIEWMLSPHNGSFVRHSRPIWQIDLKAGTGQEIGRERFRARRIPKDADVRRQLFTAYLGLVHQSAWFKHWRAYLRAAYPSFRPLTEDTAFDLVRDYYLEEYGPGSIGESLDSYLPEKLKVEYNRRGDA